MPGKKKDDRVKVKLAQIEALLDHYTDKPDLVLKETRKWVLESGDLDLRWVLKVFQKQVKIEAKDKTTWLPKEFSVLSDSSSHILMNLWCCYVVCQSGVNQTQLKFFEDSVDRVIAEQVVAVVRLIAKTASQLNNNPLPIKKYFDERMKLMSATKAQKIKREQLNRRLVS